MSAGATRALCTTAAARQLQAARFALPATSVQRRDAVLDFWFGAGAWRPQPDGAFGDVKSNFELWYGGSPELDAKIRAEFGSDVERAARGEYAGWVHESPESLLALIVLLDQFALNIYRDDKANGGGYPVSELAIPLAYTAIGRGWVERVAPAMRMFFTLPIMHSEKADDQAANMKRDPEDEFVLLHARAVLNHGRFPGRNEVLGRESDEAEKKYLAEGGVF
jgi:uncharacterized protein (DUF924 family)